MLRLATVQRDEYGFRVDVCAKITGNRVYPQPEFRGYIQHATGRSELPCVRTVKGRRKLPRNRSDRVAGGAPLAGGRIKY